MVQSVVIAGGGGTQAAMNRCDPDAPYGNARGDLDGHFASVFHLRHPAGPAPATAGGREPKHVGQNSVNGPDIRGLLGSPAKPG